ncbi:MAG: chromosome segregation protein SMC [Betaproteobacteria bacterium]|nr:chromosome segregation protein SMC [Betaproteobacteria bacterium]
MRLRSIKLAGFKSFADPTTFELPGQLVGVVGPNGCGKSNIMDAVRWVLGESKASELRGESMQDVIFNGTTNRKPASRASVELVFDNSLARAGGQWNQFAEIAVKRVLTRDGNSSYFINNQAVRRRDVQDVFLGTGLGPRAYAIIGQGTISRIIESKPEELRLFLEEAAGVSKYKERRRETENRLKDTRENLTRVEDILRELSANLDKLERQAEVAAQYRGLQAQGTLKLHQLWFLKHRDAAGEQERVQASVRQAVNDMEARMAELREVEASLESVRQDHYAASDELHVSQGALGEASLSVSRLEERIRYVVEGRERMQARLAELRAQDAQWTERQQQARLEMDDLVAQQQAAAEQSAVLAAQVEEQAAQLPDVQEALRAAQQRANDQRLRGGEVQQQIQLLAAESRSVDEQLRGLQGRRERISGERKGMVAPDEQRVEALRLERQDAQRVAEEAAARLTEIGQRLPELDNARRVAQEAANQQSARQAALSARLDALRALQDKVQTEGKLKPWLEKHGLASLTGLWTRLHIETGWEDALEAALRERLHALEVGRLDTLKAFSADPPPAKLAFYSAAAETGPTTAAAAQVQPPGPPLMGLVRTDGQDRLAHLLQDWLQGVYTAASLDAALAQRGRLQHGEVLITREGHTVSADAVTFYAHDTEQAGLLARAQEIENLQTEQRAQALLTDDARSALVRAEAAHTEANARAAQWRQEAASTQARAHQLEVQWLQLNQQNLAAQERAEQLDGELGEIDAQIEGLQERRATGEARFEELDQQLGREQELHAELEEAVIEQERRLTAAREQQRGLERQAQEAAFVGRTLQARREELQRLVHTADEQMQANAASFQAAQAEMQELDDASARAGLQEALEERLRREQALAAVRQRYEALTAQLRQADEQRMALERGLQPLRDRITQLQLEEQAAALGGAQYLEQLQAAEVDLEQLAAGIESGGVKLWGLQGEIDRINREIQALGAVNLAALDELSSARERKSFLDAQSADLVEAITTLEGAIHKIDLETRDLLGETFRQVNDHFGRMFPLLFGGGHARLVMTGDEILDAGVQVMAQPPGKKNSTIHLLSGGEKALTAIALVFAIFQLNPAPFCLLDEVDAPLDDANTERYSRLVTQMAEATQFLFISHNKIAMEMARQLVGVTMQEQGVSRIVAVDMESALSMAEAA